MAAHGASGPPAILLFPIARVFPEEFRDAAFLQGPFDDGQHCMEKGLVCRADLNAVHLEKHERGGDARSLVAIYKRMVLHNMEEVGCRHLEEIGVIIFGAASCLWHRESRLKKAQISDSFGAAVPFYLIMMDLENLFQVEE